MSVCVYVDLVSFHCRAEGRWEVFVFITWETVALKFLRMIGPFLFVLWWLVMSVCVCVCMYTLFLSIVELRVGGRCLSLSHGKR